MKPNSILFIKTKNLGDAVLHARAIGSVDKQLAVDVLCFEDCSDVYRLIPRVRNIYTVTRGLRGGRVLSNTLY